MENNDILIGLLARTDAFGRRSGTGKLPSAIAGVLEARERFSTAADCRSTAAAGPRRSEKHSSGSSTRSRRPAPSGFVVVEASG